MRYFRLQSVFIFLFIAKISLAQNWVQQTNPITGKDVNSAWAVDSNICWMCGSTTAQTSGYVILTTNGGTNWMNVTGDMPSLLLGLFSVCGINANEAWVGASNGNIYHTTNTGGNWIQVTMPNLTPTFIDVIHFFNQNTGFILGDPVSSTWCYYWTTNAGNNWMLSGPTISSTMSGWNNSYCALDTGHIWFGTNASTIYKGGFRSGFDSIPSVGKNSFGISFVNSFVGSAVMANSSYGVISNNVSTNGGTSWSAGYTPYGVQYGIKAIPGTSNVWSCGGFIAGGAILYSSNNGENWSTNFTMADIGYCITFASQRRGWVGCTSGTIYCYSGSVGIKNIGSSQPTEYYLKQNYPNPFNSSAIIKYYLPKKSLVTLKVFDLLGREISTLIDGVSQKPGTNTLTFNGSNLASGIYYYKLIANDFVSTRKMILLK